jgi:hypothetical protein
LFTGPYIGFLTSANSNIKTGNITTSVDIDNLAEKADWGIIFGGGYLTNYQMEELLSLSSDIRWGSVKLINMILIFVIKEWD